MESAGTLSPVLQYGAFGLALVLIAVVFYLCREFVLVMREALKVIPPLTESVNSLADEVEECKATTAAVRDRMLQWQCPFRGQDPVGRPA